MGNSLPANRKRRIVEIVSERNGCSVSVLSETLDVSEDTIRRDLRHLAEKELIERTHGGAVPITNIGMEAGYEQKKVQNLEQKKAIGTRATEEVHEGQVVFFDSGTTTLEVAKQVPEDISFLAVTNSPIVSLELAQSLERVKLTGGVVRYQTRALLGPGAEKYIRLLSFDLLFLATHAFDVDAGLTSPRGEEASMKELMIENSERVVLVADGTKLGNESFIKYADIDAIDLIVTADLPRNDAREKLTSIDVEVVEAPMK